MNNDFTKETVDKLANLLMIGLTDEENKMILDEFAIIDESINKINELENLNSVEPMTHALDDFECSLRDDIALESTPVEDLLSNCKQVSDREVELPKVVG